VNTLMHIDEQRIADVTVLRLSGRLELYDGDVVLRDWIDRLVDEGRVNLVLDMQHVIRLDSAGIGLLVGKFLSVRRRGGAIKLIHVTQRCRRLLHMTRLDSVFEIFDHEDQALHSFGVAA
jgi:stage II sporulation protein AA (anti-sigma F factor antagonist)